MVTIDDLGGLPPEDDTPTVRAVLEEEINLDRHWWSEFADDPKFLAAYEAAKERGARQIDLRCAYGNCTQWLDPLTGKIHGGMGPVGCPCENTPGWRSDYPAGMGKPAVPVRPHGRHGSRVQRSRRRHILPRWIREMDQEA